VGWQVIRVDDQGRVASLASGAATNHPDWQFTLQRDNDGRVVLRMDGKEVWTGQRDASAAADYPGALALSVEARSHLFVQRFQTQGRALPARLQYLAQEALLGAGENLARWQERSGPDFHSGAGVVSKEPHARVKWNVSGSRLTLWSPRGPEFGDAEILVDGRRAAVIHLRAPQPLPSQPVWTSDKLRNPFHGVVWQALTGALPVDCLQAES
jgi:hypothetical protein